MSLRRIAAADALERLAEFDTVIDARSEAEYAEDRLPGAVNWPTLDDAERHAIGTEYKQASPFAARKHGAVLALRNIAAHVEQHLQQQDRSWKPLVYCWRGGQRSGSLATVLDAIGFNVQVLEGGYREFRRAMLVQMDSLPATLSYSVVIGRTGSAKSRLLQALQAGGAQVLDLEALACHRGSVLGPLPGQPQPSQKAFETAVWQALRGFDPSRAVIAEGESRTIGRLRIPESLLVQLRASTVVQVQMPLAARVEFLLQDYAHFVDDVESFCERLSALVEVRGHEVVRDWQQRARNGEIASVVQALLTLHYDPIYLRSMQRNFIRFEEAVPLTLADGKAATLAHAAQMLQAQTAPA
ncbi:MAG: tRNA 2-selenouridine(34) synthase MnmH [Pseudomonadota bacterium]|nr:tRNA 2-selenouridine(34) synthase MnmH [Pseudomonadota bacterium]